MCFAFAVSAFGEGVDRSSALTIARQFMPGKRFVLESEVVAKRAPRKQNVEPVYVFNAEDNGGYVIVSGDDRTPAILGYSPTGHIDASNTPANMRWWLDNYALQIEAMDAETEPSGLRKSRLSAAAIEPLITTKWNQSAPYNYMCPDKNWNDYNEAGYNAEARCVTGCVATAMAQIMYYWKWPQTCPALDSYQNSEKTKTLRGLPATSFKWDLMKDTYKYKETGEAADAVAELMRYCGQAVSMQYSPGGSSSAISVRVMANTFQYSPNAREKYRDHYTMAEWDAFIYDELAARRPVPYSGHNDNAGHLFIIDGFDGDGLFHINWGWGGSGDGYYVLSIAEPGGELGAGGTPGAYQYSQYALFGLKPAEDGEERTSTDVTAYISEPQEPISYNRASSSTDFTDVSFKAICGVTSWQSVTLEIGWALYQEDLFLKLLKKEYDFTYNGEGRQWNRTLQNSLSFGADLANGIYQLCMVYRYSDTDEWQRCDNYKKNSLVAEISDNTLIFRKAASIMSFDIGELSVSEDPEVNKPVKVRAKITNTGETERLKIGVWMQSPGSSTWTGGIVHTAYASPGESTDFIFTFRSSTVGEHKLKLTYDTSEEALASATIYVAGQDTIVVAGVTYQCTPAYEYARVIFGKSTDKSQEEVTIQPTVTCNGTACRVIAIEENAFLNWYRVSSLVVPEGVERIGKRAFAYMYQLQKLELPSTLKEIGDEVIDDDEKLKAVISHVAEPFAVGEHTFAYSVWDSQASVYNYVPSTATLYVPIGTKEKYEATPGWNWFATIGEGDLLQAVVGGLRYEYATGGTTAAVVQDDSYKELTEVVVPSQITIDGRTYQVTTIAESAFDGCSSINSVTLPSTLKTIGEYAFSNCGGIECLEIPEGVENIGRRAFSYCWKLQRLVLPSTLRQIGEEIIVGLPDKAAVISHITEPFDVADNTFSDIKWNDGIGQYDPVTSNATLYVPIGTKALYEALDGWRWFADIEEGEVIEATVNGLKYMCYTGSSTATVLADDSYKELTEVTIPAEITVEGQNFNVTAIGTSAFSRCSQLKSISLPEGLEVIGSAAFMQVRLSEVAFPSTLKEIGSSAFWNCNSIRNLVIPEGVESIGSQAFEYMYGLRSLELPASLKEIGERLINGITSIKSVVSHSSEPIDVSDKTFATLVKIEGISEYQKQPSPATLYVPKGSIESYKSLSGWGWFAGIEAIADPTDAVSTPIHQPSTISKSFSLSGTRVTEGLKYKGIIINNGRKVLVK